MLADDNTYNKAYQRKSIYVIICVDNNQQCSRLPFQQRA